MPNRIRSASLGVILWLGALSALAEAPAAKTLRGHDGWVGAVAFSSDGKSLFTASADRTIVRWDAASGERQAVLKGHADAVCALAVSPDGKTLASGSHDHTARLWDAATGKPGHVLRGHAGVVMTVAFHPDGLAHPFKVPPRNPAVSTRPGFAAVLATGSIDGTIILWDVVTGKARATLKGHKTWVNSVAFAPDGRTLASASSDGTIKLWDWGKETNPATWNPNAAELRSLAWSPDGKALAVGTRYGTIQVWDVAAERSPTPSSNRRETGPGVPGPVSRRTHTLTGLRGDVWAVAFSPDGTRLAGTDGDWKRPGTVRLWQGPDWRETAGLPHTGEVLAIAFARDGKRLAAGSWDRTVKVWNLAQQGKSKP